MMICEKSFCANETPRVLSASNNIEVSGARRYTIIRIDITLSDEVTGSFISIR